MLSTFRIKFPLNRGLYFVKKILFLICAVTLTCFTAFEARANAIHTDPIGGTLSNPVSNANFGYDFTVGSNDLLVTALGLWDGPELAIATGGTTGSVGDGFFSEHIVGLWDSSGNLLAKAIMQIGTGDTLMGQFRYSATLIPTGLGPVILSAGATYVLGAAYLMNDPDFSSIDFNQTHFDGAVTGGNVRYSAGGFAFPATSNGPGAYVGPNALFTIVPNGNTVPEGGNTFLLMLLPAAAVFVSRRIFLVSPSR